MITLAELIASDDPAGAVRLTREAVDLARKELPGERLAETLAEAAITLWNSQDRRGACESFGAAVTETLELETDPPSWKELFLPLLQVAIYFGSASHGSQAPAGFQPPVQGMFLGTEGIDVSRYYPAQKVYLQYWMAVFAEGVSSYTATEVWLGRATGLASKYPAGPNIFSSAGFWVAYPLRRDDFREAARLTLLMADTTPVAVPQTDRDGNPVQQFSVASLPVAKNVPLAMLVGLVPAAIRLASLRLRNAPLADLAMHVDSIEQRVSGRPGAELVMQAVRDAVLSSMSAAACNASAGQLMSRIETTAAAIIYLIGCAFKAPVVAAMSSQAWLARHISQMYASWPSIEDEILFPFLESYWHQQAIMNFQEFSCSQAVTLRKLSHAGKAPSGTRAKTLLKNMEGCMPTPLPHDLRSWLDS